MRTNTHANIQISFEKVSSIIISLFLKNEVRRKKLEMIILHQISIVSHCKNGVDRLKERNHVKKDSLMDNTNLYV